MLFLYCTGPNFDTVGTDKIIWDMRVVGFLVLIAIFAVLTAFGQVFETFIAIPVYYSYDWPLLTGIPLIGNYPYDWS